MKHAGGAAAPSGRSRTSASASAPSGTAPGLPAIGTERSGVGERGAQLVELGGLEAEGGGFIRRRRAVGERGDEPVARAGRAGELDGHDPLGADGDDAVEGGREQPPVAEHVAHEPAKSSSSGSTSSGSSSSAATPASANPAHARTGRPVSAPSR